jgi:hypothetical protein
MLCPACRTVERVTDFKPLAKRAVLACGHDRAADIGGVSGKGKGQVREIHPEAAVAATA